MLINHVNNISLEHMYEESKWIDMTSRNTWFLTDKLIILSNSSIAPQSFAQPFNLGARIFISKDKKICSTINLPTHIKTNLFHQILEYYSHLLVKNSL